MGLTGCATRALQRRAGHVFPIFEHTAGDAHQELGRVRRRRAGTRGEQQRKQPGGAAHGAQAPEGAVHGLTASCVAWTALETTSCMITSSCVCAMHPSSARGRATPAAGEVCVRARAARPQNPWQAGTCQGEALPCLHTT
jgi:hypothetical protein